MRYLPGSADDPNTENQRVRMAIEDQMTKSLTDAGSSAYSAMLTVAGIVIRYLIDRDEVSQKMIATLADSEAPGKLWHMAEEKGAGTATV